MSCGDTGPPAPTSCSAEIGEGRAHPPHEVPPCGLLVGEALGTAQAGLVTLHQLAHCRAPRAALAGDGPSLGGRVGDAGRELQLQLHMLGQLRREIGVIIDVKQLRVDRSHNQTHKKNKS